MFPTTWEGVAQALVLVLAIAWGLALLIPAMIYLTRRAASRAKVAQDRDENVINGIAQRPAVPAIRDGSELS